MKTCYTPPRRFIETDQKKHNYLRKYLDIIFELEEIGFSFEIEPRYYRVKFGEILIRETSFNTKLSKFPDLNFVAYLSSLRLAILSSDLFKHSYQYLFD